MHWFVSSQIYWFVLIIIKCFLLGYLEDRKTAANDKDTSDY